MKEADPIKVFKIGGNVIDNPDALLRFVKDFSLVKGNKILVHGGGKEATKLAERLGIPAKMIDGRRITDRETLDIVTMVYAGLINKRIVALLQANGVNSIGMTGADADIIRAVRRKPEPIDYGYVGDIDPSDVNTDFLKGMLLERNIVPVVCAIMHDGSGDLLNCNADGVASAIAIACSTHNTSVELIYCFEKDGVLEDIDDPASLIPYINLDNYKSLTDRGVIYKGMIPKIDNAVKAIHRGVSKVIIKNSLNITNDIGTLISAK